ncbi:MAG: hypothetical protein HY271_17940 [Deltaproteobacteria bacterium]|nr:hypothetical protein [Deltaproteobacteria bacterium]
MVAVPSAQELRGAIGLLAERLGYGKLHDRLVRLNAFVSRRKPASPELLADRIYNLSGGLRLQVPATLAFHTVWSETFAGAIGEENDKKLEGIADRINATLTADERGVRDGREAELDAAIGEYERVLAAAIGPDAARLDMVLKAVPAVVERLRARPLPDVAPPSATTAKTTPTAETAPAE